MNCGYCGAPLKKDASAINRAKRECKPLYCHKACAGLARRVYKAVDQKKEEKRLYDAQRRIEKKDELKALRKAYFQRTYDPAKAAIKRQETMPRHVEYCRQPQYRKYKQQYDQQYRAKKIYGEFYEAFLLTLQLDEEVQSRASKYEISVINGILNKSQKRKREHERLNSNKS
jgi:hypothetical protein